MASAQRLAEVGDELVARRSTISNSVGLFCPGKDVSRRIIGAGEKTRIYALAQTLFGWLIDLPDPEDEIEDVECATCIAPGSKLTMSRIPRHLRVQHKLPDTVEVTFTQLTAAENTYRDAMRLPDGTEIRVQELLGAEFAVNSVTTEEREIVDERPAYATHGR